MKILVYPPTFIEACRVDKFKSDYEHFSGPRACWIAQGLVEAGNEVDFATYSSEKPTVWDFKTLSFWQADEKIIDGRYDAVVAVEADMGLRGIVQNIKTKFVNVGSSVQAGFKNPHVWLTESVDEDILHAIKRSGVKDIRQLDLGVIPWPETSNPYPDKKRRAVWLGYIYHYEYLSYLNFLAEDMAQNGGELWAAILLGHDSAGKAGMTDDYATDL